MNPDVFSIPFLKFIQLPKITRCFFLKLITFSDTKPGENLLNVKLILIYSFYLRRTCKQNHMRSENSINFYSHFFFKMIWRKKTSVVNERLEYLCERENNRHKLK